MKRIPHTWVIVFFLLLIVAFATWFVPGGKYIEIDTPHGKQLVFEPLPSVPQTWQIFSAFYKGFVRQSNIIFFILIIGGTFWIIQKSQAIEAGIYSFLRKLKRLEQFRLIRLVGVDFIVLSSIMFLFSFFGAVFGMSEETIAFVALLVPLAISLGFDSIVGVFIVYVSAHVGFAGAMLNPFTIGIAQSLAEIPPFSGIEYRTFCFLLLTALTIIWGYVYAQKIKKNPKRSPMFQMDAQWRKHIHHNTDQHITYQKTYGSLLMLIAISIALVLFSIFFPTTTISIGTDHSTHLSLTFPFIPVLTALFILLGIFFQRLSYHFFILHLLLFTIIFLIVGVLGYHWYLMEISALFLVLGIASGISMGLNANDVARRFIEGTADILSAAMVVGLAGGIIVLLEDSNILHTLLYLASSAMENTGQTMSVGFMYAIQTMLNIFIPSGSAKAALTIPIMAPFSDLVGISRQLTVLAFQFGDGFTNMITPTSGVLLGALGVARIPYALWFRFIFSFIITLIIIGFLLLLLPLFLQLPGF